MKQMFPELQNNENNRYINKQFERLDIISFKLLRDHISLTYKQINTLTK